MKFLQTEGVPFTIAGRTFDLIFSVNVMMKIYEKYNNTAAFEAEYNAAISDKEDPMRMSNMLIWLFCILVNDAIEAENETAQEKTAKITETQAKRLLKVKDFHSMQEAIILAWYDSMDIEPEPADDDDAPTEAELEAEKEAEKN